MEKKNVKVKWPCKFCGAENEQELDQLLVSNFESEIKKDLETQLQQREAELNQKRNEFNEMSKQLEIEKQSIEMLVNTRVKTLLSSKEDALKDSIRKEIDEEKSIQLQELENELIKKSSQLRELNGTKAQLEKLRREMEEAEARIILQKEQELTARLEEARSSIKEQVQQESFLKLKEREKVIEDLKNKLDEAKRQAEQGSMQLQGFVQEMELLELLTEFHPFDEITKSKTGANAADILQIVRTQSGADCGKIYYESKRTKSWSGDWIPKFKQDNLNTKADILVLVTNTNALPKGIQRYGIIDGVWVCSFNDVKELSLVLRYGLLKLQSVAIIQQGKESKMDLLYKYLTSEEFKNVFESILEGFKSIQDSHQSEKLKMQRLWKEREKTLERVLSNSIEFYGSIRGIAGEAIPEIKMLADYRQAG